MPLNEHTVLVVDDDEMFCELIELWFSEEGYAVETCSSGEACIKRLEALIPSVICLDLGLPGISGLETLQHILARAPSLPVIMLTANDNVEQVVSAMRLGAHDYVPKPVDETKLLLTVRNAITQQSMRLRLRQLERESTGAYDDIVGRSPAMQSLFLQLDRIGDSRVTVLIQGESGTGKELVARVLHKQSHREGPFVALNCAAIPEHLIESELFGHERGAFTGATERRKGCFEAADGGTIFLDEVAELDPALQAKLLRVLQERTFTRVGGSQEIRSDFRLIAATHRDLIELVGEHRFREDLFFRLAVFELEIPPLRSRGEDVILLAEGFTERFAEQENSNVPHLTQGFREMLMGHTWPGNVRELQNAIQRALVVAHNEPLKPVHLPPRILRTVQKSPASPPSQLRPAETAYLNVSTPNLDPGEVIQLPGKTLDEVERLTIVAAMKRNNENLKAVIEELGTSRTTLYRKLKSYGLK